MTQTDGPSVSILLVTYNAPRHVLHILRQLRSNTSGVDHEVVVVDNASRWPTRLLVTLARWSGFANRVALLDRNTLFAEGCNIAASLSARDSDYVLMLNPDTQPQRPDWLAHLVALHERGATGYGFVDNAPDHQPLPRADGYCLLVDRDLFLEVGMDEDFAWWWSATRLQAGLLERGHAVRAVADHQEWLTHVGGASGKAWKGARGMEVTVEEVRGWFGQEQPQRI